MTNRKRIGILGGIAYFILTLPSYLAYFSPQDLNFITSIWSRFLFYGVFPTIGVITAASTDPSIEIKHCVKECAIAGFFTGTIFGILTILRAIIDTSLGITQIYIQNLPIASQDLMARTGTDIFFTTGGFILIFLVIFPFIIGAGMLFSALGGFAFSIIRKNKYLNHNRLNQK